MSRFQSLKQRVVRALRTIRLNDSVRTFLVAFAVIGAVVAASCDKVPLTSPTGSTISLSIDKSILPVNGQATVTAVVTESAGTAVQNGTTVSFSPTMGRVDPVEATTVNGKAVVTFVAPSTSGTAVINAFSGSASTGSGNASSGGVQVRVGSAAVGGVTVNVAPSAVPQNGGTVTVSALVLDTSGNPLPSVAVLFSTDQGTLGSATVFTDGNGNASTTLTTNRVSKVAATVGAQKAEFTVNVVTAPTVTITTSTTSPTVGSPVAFTVTPSVATTANPISSVVVDFGDGQTQTLPGITGPVGLTHTYTTSGGYTVSATARDINNQVGVSSVAVVVARAALPTITLSVSPNPILITGNGFCTITLTAAATGSAAVQSVVVKFANGTILYQGTGTATFAHQFGTVPGGTTYTLIATVTDTLGNVGTTSTVVVVQ